MPCRRRRPAWASRGLRGLSADRLLRRAHLRWQRSKRGGTAVRWTQSSEAGAGLRWGQRQYRVLHRSRSHPPPTPIEVVMRRRRKTASSRVSGLLRTQRRCRRTLSLPPARIWARRAARIGSSGIFFENPAVFCYFWNETASTKTAGLSPAAAPGPVGRRSEHAFTSWVCAQAVKNAQTAAFRVPISVFWGHISGALRRG